MGRQANKIGLSKVKQCTALRGKLRNDRDLSGGTQISRIWGWIHLGISEINHIEGRLIGNNVGIFSVRANAQSGIVDCGNTNECERTFRSTLGANIDIVRIF